MNPLAKHFKHLCSTEDHNTSCRKLFNSLPFGVIVTADWRIGEIEWALERESYYRYVTAVLKERQ